MDTINKIDKARKLVKEVHKICKEYNMPYFFVTDGASGYSNNGNDAIKSARNNQIEWEKNNGFNPYEDWSKE